MSTKTKTIKLIPAVILVLTAMAFGLIAMSVDSPASSPAQAPNLNKSALSSPSDSTGSPGFSVRVPDHFSWVLI